jgi:hypothetical protein
MRPPSINARKPVGKGSGNSKVDALRKKKINEVIGAPPATRPGPVGRDDVDVNINNVNRKKD